ncbi:hypothetical protein RRG08_023608 [Elysia crispata]|uniref:Uncharacterized protein n=1 Tax=Elysia crispata TaxID=231223 RepID=A0AAE1CLK0_9GAST|nr:hypothetical protein RRG08_023608 [Elysia crispata]
MSESGTEPAPETKTPKGSIEKPPSDSGEGKRADCPENPPCTACTLFRCKTSSPLSSCGPCLFMPDKYNLSSIMRSSSPSCRPSSPLCSPRCLPSPLCATGRCPPSPLCATGRCPPSPLFTTSRCPPSPLCAPRCPPSPLSPSKCPSSPRFTLPPRCFRCCEVTNTPMRLPSSSFDSSASPPFKCDPCSFLKSDPCFSLKSDPCPRKCDPCSFKCDPCPPKTDPCPLKCGPCPAKCESGPNRYDPCCPCSDEKPPPKIATPPPSIDAPVTKNDTPPPTPPPEVVKEVKVDPCRMSPPPVHCCPSDVEIERPRYFKESITGSHTWKLHGVRIQYTNPRSPGTSVVRVGTPLKVELGVEVKACSCLSGDTITAFMWTPMKTMCNPCGTWKDLPLHLQPDKSTVDECGNKRFVYSSTLTPVESDTFRLTFNVKFGNHMIWANNYGDDNFVGVGPD